MTSEPLTFFTDECLGRRVPKYLREAELTVELYLDWFDPAVPDVEWLPMVSEKGWIVLTKDGMIGRRIVEQVALAQANARVFIMASRQPNTKEIAEGFIKARSAMEKLAQESTAPFIAKVYKSGETNLWKDHVRLKELLKQYPQKEERS